MANCCGVGLKFTFKSKKAAEEFKDKVAKTAVEEAADNYAGMDLGAHDRWVLDAELTVKDNVLVVDGWVKWALELEDFLDMLRNAGDALVMLTAEFEESGMCIKGTYRWTAGTDTIEERLLDPKKWPQVDWDSSEYDPGEEERRLLDAAFEDTPVREWSCYAIDSR